jgi:hypothetical protein
MFSTQACYISVGCGENPTATTSRAGGQGRAKGAILLVYSYECTPLRTQAVNSAMLFHGASRHHRACFMIHLWQGKWKGLLVHTQCVFAPKPACRAVRLLPELDSRIKGDHSG